MLTLDRGFLISTPCCAQSVLDPWCCSLPLQDSTSTTPVHAHICTPGIIKLFNNFAPLRSLVRRVGPVSMESTSPGAA